MNLIHSVIDFEELYICKGAKKENALASEKSCRPEKINMRVTTSQYEIYLISGQNSHLLSQNVFPPKRNLLDREKNSLEQAAFLHEVKVIPLFHPGEMTVGRCTELEELFT